MAAVSACLLVLLVACGGGRSADAWADDVCQALAPWRAEIASLNAQAQRDLAGAGSPEAAKSSLVALLSGAEEASETALDEVTAAGVPDVAGGDEVARRFTASLSATRDAYARARRDLEALPTGDDKAFYDGVAAVLSTLTAEYASSGAEMDRLDSPELAAAFDGSDQCR